MGGGVLQPPVGVMVPLLHPQGLRSPGSLCCTPVYWLWGTNTALLGCYGPQGPSLCCTSGCQGPCVVATSPRVAMMQSWGVMVPGSLPTLHPGVSYTQGSPSCTLRCQGAQGIHAAATEVYSPQDSLCYSPGCWDPHTAPLGCYGSHAAPWVAASTAAPLRVPSPCHGSLAALQSPGSPHAPLGVTAHHMLLKVSLCTSAHCSHCCPPAYSVPPCPPGCDSPLYCSLGPPVPVRSSPLLSPPIPAGGEPPEED